MNNSVVFQLAVQGGSVVSSELSQVTAKLGSMEQAVRNSTASTERLSGTMGSLGQAAANSSAGADRLSGAIGRVAHYGLAGGGVIALVGTMRAMGGALFEASAGAERLATQLQFATGNSAKEMAFVTGVANTLGLELQSTAKAYAGFAAAARGTTLEGAKVRQVFESIAGASAVMGLSTDETRGALLAIQQMMSKGVVSAEEFRGQLGERMPIALQAGANALGVTTAEFSKLLETGQIVAADFLPKFAVAIKEMLGDSVADAANRLDASTARMGNAWDRLKRTVGDAGVSRALANEATGLSNYMDALSDSMERARQNGSGLAGQLSAGLGQAMARMPFDALSASSNALNGTINALTGNVFKLNTNLDLLPTALKSNAQQGLALAGQLKAAESELSTLQQRLGQQPDNIYLKSETYQATLLVQQLRAAKQARDALQGAGAGRGNVNPAAVEDASVAQNRFSTAMEKYASNTEKANAAVEALRKAHGNLFTPEWEQKVRASFGSQSTGLSVAAKGLALYNDLTAQASGLNADFAEKWAQLSAAYQRGTLSTEQLTSAQAALLQQQTFAKDAAKDWANQARESARAVQESTKAYERQVASLQQSADSVANQVQKLQDEEKAAAIAAAQNISLAEAIELVTAARLQERMTAAYAAGEQEAGDAIKQEITNRRELAGLINSKEAREASTKAAKDAAEAATNEWRKAAEKINDSITDALMRGFESGKDFAANLRDTVVNMFKTMVLRPVVSAIINPVAMAGASLLGSGGALAGQAGSGAGMVQQLSAVQTLKNMYDVAVGGFESLSLAVNNGMVELGAYVGQYNSTVGAAINSSASTIGAAAGYAGGMMAGKAIGDAISGGYGVNGTGSAVVNIGTVIGAIAGGPIGAAIGGAVAGLFNRAFGMGATELRAQGTRGTFSQAGFSGYNYATYHQDGGWFRSDRNWTETSALDASRATAMGNAFGAVQTGVAQAAKQLGLMTDSILRYTRSVDIAAGSSKEAMEALFTSMADDMANLAAPGLAAFAKAEESASATLNRLSSSLTSVNQWLLMLRQRTYQVSLASADAASRLADLFGGLDGFSNATKAYYDLFYSETERTTQQQIDMAKALALVNQTLPDSKASFRELASSMDLNTESGRRAYAVLLAIAPEFANTADSLSRLSLQTARKLIDGYTARGLLLPALNSVALRIGDVAQQSTPMANGLQRIHALLLNGSSSVLTFAERTAALDDGMTASQRSAQLLNEQLLTLKERADGGRIQIDGLALALQNVSTETFINTLSLVFENLANRISKVLDNVASERTAVREAALQIINPTALSKAQIQSGIASVNTGLPSDAGVQAAQSKLQQVGQALQGIDNVIALQQKTVADAGTALTQAQNNLNSRIDYYKGKAAEFQNTAAGYGLRAFAAGAAHDGNGWYPNNAYNYNAQTNSLAGWGGQHGYVSTETWNWAGKLLGKQDSRTDTSLNTPAFLDNVWGSGLVGTLEGGNANLAAAANSITQAQKAQAAAQTALQSANTTRSQILAEQTSAQEAAKVAALEYTKAIQQFSLDAGKSVARLGKLREETVRYYEAQKALASLMASSASGLRNSVASYQYSRLSEQQQLDSLQTQFNTAYSLALSTSGETLAGYGDKLNSLLAPLLEKAQEVMGNTSAYETLAATTIARAEAVASKLESSAPTNYAADSLAMLGDIDAALAAVENATITAERLISDAIKAGSDKTATGLNAIVQALTGKAIPGYALGGDFEGGLRIVGENGPELEATGPSRIFSAAQTRSILQGGGNDMVAELRALRADNAAMRAELRAIASSNAKLARLAERAEQEGALIRTEKDQPLHTLSAWT